MHISSMLQADRDCRHLRVALSRPQCWCVRNLVPRSVRGGPRGVRSRRASVWLAWRPFLASSPRPSAYRYDGPLVAHDQVEEATAGVSSAYMRTNVDTGRPLPAIITIAKAGLTEYPEAS